MRTQTLCARLSTFALLLGITSLMGDLLPLAPAVAPVGDAEAATTYFATGAEHGDLDDWDLLLGTPNYQAEVTQTPVRSGHWAMDLTSGETTGENAIKLYKSEFAPGPGRGGHHGMVEGYFSAWYWFGATGWLPKEWHNHMQWMAKHPSNPPWAALVNYLGVWDWDNTLQAVWVMFNCSKKVHPQTQVCPTFPAYIARGQNYGYLFQKTPVAIPRQQWVHFEVYYKAARTGGMVRVWQDGELIFDLSDATKTGTVAFNTLDATSLANNTTISWTCLDVPEPCVNDLRWSVNNYSGPSPALHPLYVDDVAVTDYRVGFSQ